MSRTSALTNEIRGSGEQIEEIAGSFARGDVLANS